MITVQELMAYCIDREYSLMAHTCFWAISTQGINPDDDSEKLKDLTFDQVAITELVKTNILGFGQVKLFGLELQNRIYAFYFAKTSYEALSLHRYLFGGSASKISEAKPRLLNTKMFWPDTEQEMTLLEYRKQLLDFPAYVGHARAGEHVLYKLQRGVKQVV